MYFRQSEPQARTHFARNEIFSFLILGMNAVWQQHDLFWNFFFSFFVYALLQCFHTVFSAAAAFAATTTTTAVVAYRLIGAPKKNKMNTTEESKIRRQKTKENQQKYRKQAAIIFLSKQIY